MTVAPALAERQAWNAWPDGTARLFNDAVAFVWNVQIDGERPTRWDPARTSLAVNDTDQVFAASAIPEGVLGPILQGAALEAMLGMQGDLALRARSADPFRQAYLDTRSVVGANDGVVVFQTPTQNIHAVAMQLTVSVVVEGGGTQEFRFLFE